ncbi:RluA family pseudouridine synthase [Marinobacter sp. F4216]|uniref:RluA family pseudouridine synthase n=1 Tax=Marinobacter sp. F4216 TaxID=2874281 RepID=UPI001CC03DF3|nr:RluA family pseudouridine synthase [Marinobacter sp. F4216]MBZ2167831.1 RluA family pseudouridine synthase [Marinobacter sp. F4216]
MRTIIDLTAERPQTAVDALSEASDLPKQRIKDAMAKGACWWTQKGKRVRLRKAKREVKTGTRLELYYDDTVLARTPPPAQLIADFKRYSAWFKPHGMLSQGSQWGDHCSLLRWAEQELQRDCHLIHRLDADAAGLMLIAHDTKAAGALSQLFSGRQMTKRYEAQVIGKLDAENLRVKQPIDGKEAISVINTLSYSEPDHSTLVSVDIETGRKHQIRKHLAHLGHPIIGDRLYGKPASCSLQLTARFLEFDCPLTRRRMTLELPGDIGSSNDA